jgi:hypothetical protein
MRGRPREPDRGSKKPESECDHKERGTAVPAHRYAIAGLRAERAKEPAARTNVVGPAGFEPATRGL